MGATSVGKKARLAVDVEVRLQDFRLNVQLEVGSEILVLFGPSGAGKTTTLNAIAGLVTPVAGEIALDGRVFFRKHRPGPPANLPARDRRVGYVFQEYALFPHLTALQNVAYPFWRQGQGDRQAVALLERMSLTDLAHRYPHELSGGQQQRVAIARALAAKPQVLLLDEPFSALDVPVKEQLQAELIALQQELGLVVVYVTHNLEDAFAVGHRMAVIRDGKIEQVGTVQDVYHRPASLRVAEIMGIRNVFRARVVDALPEARLLDWNGLILEAPLQQVAVGEVVTCYIRPDHIKVLPPDTPHVAAMERNQVGGKVLTQRLNSTHHLLRVSLANGSLVEVRLYVPSSSVQLYPGNDVLLSFPPEALELLPSGVSH